MEVWTWRSAPLLVVVFCATAASFPTGAPDVGGDSPTPTDLHWTTRALAAPSAAPATFDASPDSSELHRRARRLQGRFEELRRRALPRSAGSNPWQECDEEVGRFCLFFGDEDDAGWEPIPDSPEILQARGDLLDSLTAVASEIPGDGWVVSQLVQYLGEEGRWSEALEWVDDCGVWADDETSGGADDRGGGGRGGGAVVSSFNRAQPGWWCYALRGYVLHRSDRYREAETAFERALQRMHPDRRNRWLNPDPLLDGEADDVWDDTGIDERDALRARLWALADPLHLVAGNDRLTEHFARHTVSWIREDAENPYGMSWGWDLEELVVRYGEEMGWNRTRTPGGSLRPASVVGHHHPESRHFLPPGKALADPTAFGEPGWGGGFEVDGGGGADDPTTAHAPPYAPEFRFEPYQTARFPRGEEMIVVAGYGLPSEEGSDGGPGTAAPRSGSGVRAGLFLLDAAGNPVASTTREVPHTSGAFSLRVPAGRYLASVEVWDSAGARAGRSRTAIGLEALRPDVAALSDLLIMERGADPPEELEEAVSRVRPVPEACAGADIVVGWELTGVGLRREAVEFALLLEPRGRGFFSRVGDFLGLTSPPEPLTLEWTEEGPDHLRPFFRSVRLALPPEMEPGSHRLTLEARLDGRGPLITQRRVEVREPPSCDAPGTAFR